VLKAAGDTPIEIYRKHTGPRGLLNIDFMAWERKGSYEEL